MDVLMQILFERFKSFVECLVANARVSRNPVIGADSAQFAQKVASGIVLHHHHANRIVDCAKGSERRGPVLGLRFVEFQNIREENLFFLKHVRLQICE